MKAWEALSLAQANEPSVKIVYKLTEHLSGTVTLDMGIEEEAVEAHMLFANWDVVSLNAQDDYLVIEIKEGASA